jgi:hypothetical protein
MCRANAEDLAAGGETLGGGLTERMFQSSVGFLSRGTDAPAS